MTKPKNLLTELEGAVLTEIAYRGNCTSFKVRRAFELSPSASWSGSAGAVYPAIRRLIERGVILAQATADNRGTQMLSVSRKGERLLEEWCCDPVLASTLGFDPFRLRSGLWKMLTYERRRRLVKGLKSTISEGIRRLKAENHSDVIDRAQTQLAIKLQSMRLDWLEESFSPTNKLDS